MLTAAKTNLPIVVVLALGVVMALGSAALLLVTPAPAPAAPIRIVAAPKTTNAPPLPGQERSGVVLSADGSTRGGSAG